MVVNHLLRAFFEDLARAEDDAASAVREALTSAEIPTWVTDEDAVGVLRTALRTPQHANALAKFVQEMVHIGLHSALVSIDGGSASAEVGELQLTDGAGVSLGDGLHERYVDYLMDTGRIT